ncbi:hypothetical protein OBBRIDRAFT_770017 [Obba rivulosa]|uniref:Uncharacterized protein n=1 Tax=Obba rivulosa TaxID=1052685 RepID=A0A8E2J402_9APHY|nr:hypothetical protein OBBRIDRAFT_770017 [Obba rivulosa]
MSASISDPFLLSSYALPSRARQSSAPSTSAGPSRSIFATHSHVREGDKSEGYVTVAVQGDGIHVLDVSSDHPCSRAFLANVHTAISHTLGPSTSFQCPPVTRNTLVDDVQTCTTYAAIAVAPDVPPEARSKTVWAWEDKLIGGVMSADSQKKRKSAQVLSPIAHIYTPEELPGRVLLVSTSGQLTVTDADLLTQQPPPPLPAQDADWSLLRHFLIPRQSCTFSLSRKVPSQGVISVAFLRKENSALRLSVIGVGHNGYIALLGIVAVPVEETDIADVTCSNSGFITILTSSGLWYSFQLESRDASTLSLQPRADPLRFHSLSFLPPYNPTLTFHASEIALLPLTASHVLLAGVTTQSSAELVLLLWDMQYSVVLAQHTFAVPSALGRTKAAGLHLALVDAPASAHHALLLLAGPARASVLAVPLGVPPRSTLGAALGRGGSARRWLAAAPRPNLQPLQPGQGRALSGVMERHPEAAAEAFFAYASQDGAEFGYTFVKMLLEQVFRVPKGAETIPYAPKIVRWLLEKRAVSYGMVEGGLFPALMARNDWPSAMLAMQTVTDVPEGNMMSLLAKVVAARRSEQPVTEDAMQIDSAPAALADTDLPSLASFLALCVAYPTTPATLRIALREHLREAEGLTAVLSVLSSWIDRWGAEDELLLPEGVAKDAHGVPVPVFPAQEKRDIPPIEKILTFTQALIDASFLTLLGHAPAQPLLRGLLERLEPQFVRVSALAQLAGALQPFAAAHARAVREGSTGAAAKAEACVDWRRRRRAAHEQAEMGLGAYQVEELVL